MECDKNAEMIYFGEKKSPFEITCTSCSKKYYTLMVVNGVKFCNECNINRKNNFRSGITKTIERHGKLINELCKSVSQDKIE